MLRLAQILGVDLYMGLIKTQVNTVRRTLKQKKRREEIESGGEIRSFGRNPDEMYHTTEQL